MTPAEEELIREAAHAAGLPLGTYVRNAALRRQMLKRGITADAEKLVSLLAHTGKIGGNLNQLAYKVNQGVLPPPQQLDRTLKAIAEMRTMLREALGRHDH